MTARHRGHTRKRLPTLSQLDLDSTDDYEIMQSGSRDAGAGSYRRLTGGSKADLPLLGGVPGRDGPRCWCGERYDHAWPGQAEGAPHPVWRAPSPPALGHACLFSEVLGEHMGVITVRVCVFCGKTGPLTPEEAERERALLDRLERRRQGAA